MAARLSIWVEPGDHSGAHYWATVARQFRVDAVLSKQLPRDNTPVLHWPPRGHYTHELPPRTNPVFVYGWPVYVAQDFEQRACAQPHEVVLDLRKTPRRAFTRRLPALRDYLRTFRSTGIAVVVPERHVAAVRMSELRVGTRLPCDAKAFVWLPGTTDPCMNNAACCMRNGLVPYMMTRDHACKMHALFLETVVAVKRRGSTLEIV